jgi:hypothetical protein
MKWILAVLISIFLSGCVVLGTNWIHSPTSDLGIALKNRHVHGGATKNSPPDALGFFYEQDSITIIVSAQTISEKKNFGGVVLPILPLFWLPKINSYKGQPNTLIIKVSTSSSKNIELQTDSTTIIANGQQLYSISTAMATNVPMQNFLAYGVTLLNSWELKFPLEAEQTDAFELNKLAFSINNEPRHVPTIKFQKVKQRWAFMGP